MKTNNVEFLITLVDESGEYPHTHTVPIYSSTRFWFQVAKVGLIFRSGVVDGKEIISTEMVNLLSYIHAHIDRISTFFEVTKVEHVKDGVYNFYFKEESDKSTERTIKNIIRYTGSNDFSSKHLGLTEHGLKFQIINNYIIGQ